MTWSSTGITATLLRTSVPCASVSPDQPSGIHAVAPSSSSACGPRATCRGRSTCDGRRRSELGGSDGDELERAIAIRVAVALLVRLVEALCEVRAERNGELERLAGVANVGLALVR